MMVAVGFNPDPYTSQEFFTLDFPGMKVFEELAVPVRFVLRNSVCRLAGTA